MDKTYKKNVQFTRSQLQQMKALSSKTQLGRSELVRRAVDHYLNEVRRQGTLPSIDSIKSLTPDSTAEER